MPRGQESVRSSLELAPGDVIAGRYVVEDVLGSGGMGTVVRARHLSLGQRVAVKCLRGALLRSAEAFARFTREARAIAAIQSDHVVRVVDFGASDEGLPYLVMEHLVGRDLSQELAARGPLPVTEVVDYVIQACAGLAAAHAHGVVHRDIKPANLFLSTLVNGDTRIKVIDFGVSKLDTGDEADLELTRTATSLGSPHYMSPEQVRDARRVDARTDVWSLGVVLFKLLTGETPFAGRDLAAVSAAIAADAPRSLAEARPDAPAELEAVIRRCLAKSAAERFDGAASLASALAPFASSRGKRDAALVRPVDLPLAPSPAAAPRRDEPTAATQVADISGGLARTGPENARPPSRWAAKVAAGGIAGVLLAAVAFAALRSSAAPAHASAAALAISLAPPAAPLDTLPPSSASALPAPAATPAVSAQPVASAAKPAASSPATTAAARYVPPAPPRPTPKPPTPTRYGAGVLDD